jgi:hypothetical protein
MAKKSAVSPRGQVETEIDGRKHLGRYEIARSDRTSTITVTYKGRSATTHVGSSAEVIARLLLRELVSSASVAGEKFRFDRHPSRPNDLAERRRRLRGVSAWLLEWRREDPTADERDRRIVGIFSPRWSHQRIGDLAMGIFCAARLVPGEMRSRMLLGREAPGQAQWAKLKHQMWGKERTIEWHGRFTIGGDPYMFGRLVRNLKEPQLGKLTWDELPPPEIPALP